MLDDKNKKGGMAKSQGDTSQDTTSGDLGTSQDMNNTDMSDTSETTDTQDTSSEDQSGSAGGEAVEVVDEEFDDDQLGDLDSYDAIEE